jgi:cobalt-zinc-cadmium efflux system outer membrane protein
MHAAAGAMTLDEALRIARETGPAVLSARARTEEARAKLAGATRLIAFNPEIEVEGGNRSGPAGDSEELAAHFVQPLDIGPRRSARMAAGHAEMDVVRAEAEEALQAHLAEIATAFLQAIHETERMRIELADQQVATSTLDAARRRYESGDVAILDVNVARAELGRVSARVEQARAALATAIGTLRAALGWEPGAPLDLEGAMAPPQVASRGELMKQALERPAVRKLRAELARARADYRSAAAKRWPDLGVGVGYEREVDDEIVTGGLRLALPLFDRGQSERAEALAREQRLTLEVDAAARRAQVEVAASYDAFDAKRAALAELEATTLSLLEENESLSRRSYLAGQASLSELLLIRGQVLQIRLEHLDLLLEVALAGVAVLAAAGGLS